MKNNHLLRDTPMKPPAAGRRVIHDGTGKTGTIAVDPGNTATRVMVIFDGADHAVPCSPGSLEYEFPFAEHGTRIALVRGL